jgi:hypothetical protein
MRRISFNHLYGSVFMICISLCLFGCANKDEKIEPSIYAPVDFKEEDLIGTWNANGSSYSTEVLSLSADHKFTQEFQSSNPKFQAISSGTWETKKSEKGCLHLFLYGMKYFYQDMERASNGNRRPSGVEKGSPIQYWDECSQHEITMPDMVVLAVMQFPDTPKNIVLQHMTTSRESTDIWFTFVGENLGGN